MKKLLLVVLIIVGLVGCGTAWGKDINVLPDDKPTIQEAIDEADEGDVVLLADGTYTGNIHLKGKSITIKSSGGAEECIIDCDHKGPGFLVYNGETVTFEGLTVKNGDADDGNNGGGIYAKKSEIIVVECIFTGNSASSGGAVYFSSYDYYSSSFSNCTFTGNNASSSGGAVYSSSSSFSNCTFTGNSASSGGAVYFSLYYSSSFSNCTFTGNSASSGGAIYSYYYSSSSSVTNCTFTLNEATEQGGAIWCYIPLAPDDPITLKNCILWGNTAKKDPEIYEKQKPLIITYSDIQDGHAGTGNIDSDPLFVDAVNDDLHLQDISPCIDTGTADGAPADDLDGNYRPVSSGDDIGYDMGAYEYQEPIVIDSFTAERTGTPSLIVDFTCTAHDDSNIITGYQWDFGDGDTHTSDTGIIQHTYIISGPFTVTCTVVNNHSDQTTATIIVNNDSPIANAGQDQIIPGDSVELDGSASNDPDGTISSWEWTLSHTEDSHYDKTAAGETPTVAKLEHGNYTVTLTVTDNYGDTGTDEMHLCVAASTSNAIYTQAEFDQNYTDGYTAGQDDCKQCPICPIREDDQGNKFLEGPLTIKDNGLLTIQ